MRRLHKKLLKLIQMIQCYGIEQAIEPQKQRKDKFTSKKKKQAASVCLIE